MHEIILKMKWSHFHTQFELDLFDSKDSANRLLLNFMKYK